MTYQGDNRQTKIQIVKHAKWQKIGMGSRYLRVLRIERTYHLAGFEGEGDYNFSRIPPIELKVGAGSAEEIILNFNLAEKKWCVERRRCDTKRRYRRGL